MTEQDERQNNCAVTRIKHKIEKRKLRLRADRMAALMLCVALVSSALTYAVTEWAQEKHIAPYSDETAKVEESIGQAVLSPEDRLLVAKICMAETNTYEGYMAVAQTIHDRSVLWSQEVYEVATADRQFAAPYNGKASEEALRAVDAVFLDGERAFGTNVTHFYSGDAPYWSESKEYVGSRGGNHFLNSKY